jgi:histidinol-phosphate aminotransferase
MRNSEYISKLYRPALEKTKKNDYIYLDKNEPPFSAFDSVFDLITNENILNLREYPDAYELYEKLAIFTNVNIHNLLITQGSEQALKYIFEVFVEENDEVIYYNPSFAMYDVYCFQKKAKVKQLEFDENGNMILSDILSSVTKNTRLFSLINPHNFTGTYLNIDELKTIAEHTKKTGTIFLLDEAYYHYIEINSINLIKHYSHIIITRTFSKALGVPGCRVGYAIASYENIDLLRKYKPINEIDYLSGIISEKILNNAEKILSKNVNQVKKWQQIFKNADFKDIEYLDTYANFILLKSLTYEYHKKLLLDNKIITRLDFKVDCLGNCIRFSIIDDLNMQKIYDLF